MGTERDFVVKKGLTVTDDINVSGDINVSSLYGRLNFKKNAAGSVNNDAIYFINGSDQYAGAVKYFHSGNTLRFDANQQTQLHISDGAIFPPTDSDVDLGTTSLRFKDTFVDSITVTGAVTPASITLGGHSFNDIDVGTEFVDTDDHLMSSGAIKEKIEDYGYTTNTGTLVAGAQTGITSVLNTGLVIGRDSTDQIKFGTDNQIIFRVGNADGVTFKASGEIEATKFDGALEGNADTASVASRVVVVANNAAGSFVNENNLILFSPDGASSNDGGNLTPESSTAFHYNPSSTVLTVPKITGDVTGDVTGTATNATAITLGGHLINDVDIGTELVDTDDHIMSSGAIKAYVDANAGGASALNDLSDVIASGSGNLWIAPGATPTHGTLSTAIQNISIGKLAGDAITEGDRNIAIGTGAGSGITTGEGNISIGDFAQYTQTTGSANVVVGRQALFGNGVKNNNSGFGHNALYATTTGSNNVALGFEAGNNITSGSHNVVIGNADVASATGDSQLSISDGDGGVTWITGASTGVVNFPNGLTSGGSAVGGASAIDGLSDASTTATSVWLASTPATATDYNASLGIGALDALNGTNGTKNVAVGYNAGTANTEGFKNVFVGYAAGAANTNADYNVFVGSQAGAANTTGLRNIAIGANALDAADTENDNIAIGYGALGGAVAGGEFNVAIGNYTLDALTSADNNVAIGHYAGSSLTTQGSNVMIGWEAGKSSTSTQSTYIGYYAGINNLSNYNTAIGAEAMMTYGDKTAERNVAIGNAALKVIQTGDKNTAVGAYNGLAVTTGSDNIFLGYSAGDNITTGDNNVVIGAADVTATGDDQLSISSGDGGVTWIEGNSDGVVLGALTPLFFERQSLNTSAVDFRVPVTGSSTANPNGYPMPFAGKVVAASFLFTGTIADDTNTNTMRIRKNGGSSGGDIKEFTFTGGDLLHPSGNTLVKSGSDVLLTFAAGDIIQIRREGGSTNLQNAQAMLWVSFNF